MAEQLLSAPPGDPSLVVLATRPRSPWLDGWRHFRRDRIAMASVIFLALVAILAIAAPLVSRYPPDAQDFLPFVKPGAAHWMGTDELGRDQWSRVVYGARISLEVGIGSQLIALAIGLVIGAWAGFGGRLADSLLMRLTDIGQALPPLLLALLFLAVFGNSTAVLVLAIGLATWPVMARIVRAQVLQLREQDFVEAAYAIGSSPRRVLIRHVLPNATGPIIVQVTFGIAQAIFAEAFLSFIGLGPPPPSSSWGRLVADGYEFLRTSPYLVLFPGIALSLTLVALSFVGDALRDAFDPRRSR